MLLAAELIVLSPKEIWLVSATHWVAPSGRASVTVYPIVLFTFITFCPIVHVEVGKRKRPAPYLSSLSSKVATASVIAPVVLRA